MGSQRAPAAYLLFANPSFWAGFGQILDLGNTMFEYNQSLGPEQADALAINADWLAIGDDFRTVLDDVDESKAHLAVRGG